MEQSIAGLDEKATNSCSTISNQVESAAVQSNALEKSKSDSRLNQFGEHSLQQGIEANDEELIRRSASNHSVVRHSPKKKAKSFSRLSELDKEVSLKSSQEKKLNFVKNKIFLIDIRLGYGSTILIRFGYSAKH